MSGCAEKPMDLSQQVAYGFPLTIYGVSSINVVAATLGSVGMSFAGETS
jgi:hypothetical protein